MQPPEKATDQVTGTDNDGRQPTSRVARPSAQPGRVTKGVIKGVNVFNGLLRGAIGLGGLVVAFLGFTHGQPLVGVGLLLASAYYLWLSWRWLTR